MEFFYCFLFVAGHSGHPLRIQLLKSPVACLIAGDLLQAISNSERRRLRESEARGFGRRRCRKETLPPVRLEETDQGTKEKVKGARLGAVSGACVSQTRRDQEG